jgi:alpha-D-ribose 1-methylphosphonate 5-phosphate C-P lyase
MSAAHTRSDTLAGLITAESRHRADASAGTPADSPSGFLDEDTTRAMRCALLVAVAVPGYQVPFDSQEMPVPRGWGTGGLQVTLALLGADDVVKVIDQGDDDSMNAVSLREFLREVSGAMTTTETAAATIIQSRHRIPEAPMRSDQILVLQVPDPEPLSAVEKRPAHQRRMHAEADYAEIWVSLYEDQVHRGAIAKVIGYPCMVAERYLVAPSPIPKWDVLKLNRSQHLSLFGAGREARVYAIPPHTSVAPLTFDDIAFDVGAQPGARCQRCGSDNTYLVESGQAFSSGDQAARGWVCSDTDWCHQHRGTR